MAAKLSTPPAHVPGTFSIEPAFARAARARAPTRFDAPGRKFLRRCSEVNCFEGGLMPRGAKAHGQTGLEMLSVDQDML